MINKFRENKLTLPYFRSRMSRISKEIGLESLQVKTQNKTEEITRSACQQMANRTSAEQLRCTLSKIRCVAFIIFE